MGYYKSLDHPDSKIKHDDKEYFTEYELADLINEINDNFKDDIEKQGCIMSIIDYQFE